MHTFRQSIFRTLFLLTAILVVMFCALKTNIAYHSQLVKSAPTPAPYMSEAALFNSSSIEKIVHNITPIDEPCRLTQKLLGQSFAHLETFTPLLFLVALLALLSERKVKPAHTRRSDTYPPKLRLHVTHCTFRE
ncbi:hypothetical protein [Vibrio barjaei]|uniref:hypothetical protein n=1 Tax=Vibrio barjaei TaxID=1676683 RepID=UPI002283387A|nr:hypothetical protein [Vibrio barjaei]MCY9870720.1 hypothetical protein [Vibrio barjaei]